jgi:hypothetical protein
MRRILRLGAAVGFIVAIAAPTRGQSLTTVGSYNGYPLARQWLQTQLVAASEVEIDRAEFGLFKDATRQADFTQTDVVPLVIGQFYGWRIFLKTSDKTVRVREEFELPTAPKTWGNATPGQTVSPDRTISTIDRYEPVVGGLIERRWGVAQGDPAGAYTIRVVVEGSPAVTFQFTVK